MSHRTICIHSFTSRQAVHVLVSKRPFARSVAPAGAKQPSLQVEVEANPTMAIEGGGQATGGSSRTIR